MDIYLPAFRDDFPELNETLFPDSRVERAFYRSQSFLTKSNTLNVNEFGYALHLMTAHLLWCRHLISKGQTTANIVTGATVSKVSVTMTPPPFGSAWQFWLSSTPYGVELWSLLNIKAAGGAYVGGLPERTAFRKVGGVFM